jgi:5-methylthioribose kinase
MIIMIKWFHCFISQTLTLSMFSVTLMYLDPEFTVYSSPGLDVGSLLSGYVLAAVHQAFLKNEEAVASVAEGAESIWSSYKEAMEQGGISSEMIKKIEIETVGFTVAEVCRTALEFAGGRKWLQFEDPEVKSNARKAALNIVSNCMTARHEGGMTLLLDEMKKVF